MTAEDGRVNVLVVGDWPALVTVIVLAVPLKTILVPPVKLKSASDCSSALSGGISMCLAPGVQTPRLVKFGWLRPGHVALPSLSLIELSARHGSSSGTIPWRASASIGSA